MLGSARILGVQRGNVADGVFLYFELFDFQIQRRPRNSEFGSIIWRNAHVSHNASTQLFQQRPNDLLLFVPS